MLSPRQRSFSIDHSTSLNLTLIRTVDSCPRRPAGAAASRTRSYLFSSSKRREGYLACLAPARELEAGPTPISNLVDDLR